MSNPPSKTAAGYIRLSPRDDVTGLQPETQRRIIRDWAAAQGVTIADWYEDIDISGKTAENRPALGKLRQSGGSYDYWVAVKIDRIARNVRDFLAIADDAQAAGAGLVAVRDNLDMSTPTGRFFATVLAAFAEMELATITARINDGIATAKAAGKWTGRVPNGFKLDADQRLIVDDNRAPVVRDAAERILNGEPLRQVARSLRSQPTTIKRWLLHERMPDILGAETYHELSDKLTGKTRADWSNSTGLLGGLLRCATCGGTMTASKASNGTRRYSCARRCNAAASINAEPLEHLLVAAWQDSEGPHQQVIIRKQRDLNTERIAALRTEQNTLNAALSKLDRKQQRVTLDRLDELDAEIERLQDAAGTTNVYVNTGKTWQQVWDAADTLHRRDLLKRILTDGVLSIAPSGGKRGIPAVDRIADPAQVGPHWSDEHTTRADVYEWLQALDADQARAPQAS